MHNVNDILNEIIAVRKHGEFHVHLKGHPLKEEPLCKQ